MGHGPAARHRGRPAGSFGDLAVLSFNGNKIITTSGGGALLGRPLTDPVAPEDRARVRERAEAAEAELVGLAPRAAAERMRRAAVEVRAPLRGVRQHRKPCAPGQRRHQIVHVERPPACHAVGNQQRGAAASIDLAFTGILNDKLRGFYRSTFVDAASRSLPSASTTTAPEPSMVPASAAEPKSSRMSSWSGPICRCGSSI